jgi:hypothetical protein
MDKLIKIVTVNLICVIKIGMRVIFANSNNVLEYFFQLELPLQIAEN